MRGVEYHLGSMILSNGHHFYSIVLDPIPLGDLNIFYDGMKQGNSYSNLAPFVGSYKPVVGSYDIGPLQTKNTGNLPVHSQNVRVYREVTGISRVYGGLPDFFTLLKLQFCLSR